MEEVIIILDYKPKEGILQMVNDTSVLCFEKKLI